MAVLFRCVKQCEDKPRVEWTDCKSTGTQDTRDRTGTAGGRSRSKAMGLRMVVSGKDTHCLESGGEACFSRGKHKDKGGQLTMPCMAGFRYDVMGTFLE